MSTPDPYAFDFEAMFDKDYLFFHAPLLEERSDADADLIERILQLKPRARILDLGCGRARTERPIVKDGRTRQVTFSVRMFMPAELSDWLTNAGFAAVAFYDNRGEPLTALSRRAIALARMPLA